MTIIRFIAFFVVVVVVIAVFLTTLLSSVIQFYRETKLGRGFDERNILRQHIFATIFMTNSLIVGNHA